MSIISTVNKLYCGISIFFQLWQLRKLQSFKIGRDFLDYPVYITKVVATKDEELMFFGNFMNSK